MAFTPGELLRKCAGDWRSMLPGPSAGLMQLMYPPLGKAVMDHSDFVKDPMGRVNRSVPQIWATLLAADGRQRAKKIKDVHRYIEGKDNNDKKYHALNPETFWWAHATFTWEMFRSYELFHLRQLSPSEKAQLYDDTVEWYRSYGMSMRPVPENLDRFYEQFFDICLNTLEITEAAQMTIDLAKKGGSLNFSYDPRNWPQLGRKALDPGPLIFFGALPIQLRNRFKNILELSSIDKLRLQNSLISLRILFGALPQSVNKATLVYTLKKIGNETRSQRYIPKKTLNRQLDEVLH
jgi:uncharacterized protein (DUF2236 family)